MGLFDEIYSWFINKDLKKLIKSNGWKFLESEYKNNSQELILLNNKIKEERKRLKSINDELKKMGAKGFTGSNGNVKKVRSTKYYKGEICKFCSSEIKLERKSQFCSVKCEIEYLEFKKH